MVTRREFMVWAGAAAAAGALAPRRGLAGLGRRGGTVLEWEELRPGFFACVNPNSGGNTLAVAQRGGVLVIDTKYPYLGAAIRADALSMTEGGAPVTLINTHHHGDHTGGNVAFTGRGPTHAHPRAIERIEGQAETYKKWAAGSPSQAGRFDRANRELQRMAQELAERVDGLDADDWTPTGALRDGAAVPFEHAKGSVRHFGAGHTDNDLVVRFDDNVVHTGDLVFNAMHPYFDPEGGATAIGWVEALKGARGLCDADTVVVPGHGPVGDRSIIDGQIGYLESLIEAVRGEIDAGVEREVVLTRQYPFMSGLGFAQVRERAIGAVYDELSTDGG